MARIIPPELLADIVKDEVNIADFIIIRLVGIDEPLFFTNHDKDLQFYDDNGDACTYIAIPFEVGDVEDNTESKFSQVTITLANVTNEFSQLVMETDVEGAEVVIGKASLNVLLPGMLLEIYRGIADKPSSVEKTFELTVVSAGELRSITVPRRYFRRSCQWVLGDVDNCPYPNPTTAVCNKSYQRCQELGQTASFGGFRKIPAIADVRGANG